MCQICDNDHNIPESCKLECCENVEHIPNLFGLKELFKPNGKKLKSVESIDTLEVLTVDNASLLAELPEFKNLQYIGLCTCKILKKIQDLNTINTIGIIECPFLESNSLFHNYIFCNQFQ
jgi:hypothetical protein